jgi:threonine/homoserine/homoserine lactone efflux protein
VPPLQSIAAFAALSFALIAVPGPSVTFVISRAVALGRRAAVLTVVGNAAGVYVQVVFVALGLGAIVERSVLAFTAIKLLGAAYLVWLGIEAIRDRRDLAGVLDATDVVKSRGSVLRDGFLVGIAIPRRSCSSRRCCPSSSNWAPPRRGCRWRSSVLSSC